MKNPLSVLWKNLKENLASKGGRRPGPLPFYLTEYVWQAGRRQRKPEEQLDHLLRLLFDLQSQRPKLHAPTAIRLP